MRKAIMVALVVAWMVSGAAAGEQHDERSAKLKIRITASPEGMVAVAEFPGGTTKVERKGDEMSFSVEGEDVEQAHRAARMLVAMYQDLMRGTEPLAPGRSGRPDREVSRVRDEREPREREIDQLRRAMARREAATAELAEVVERLERQVGELRERLHEKERVIVDLKARLEEKEEEE